MIAKQDDKRQRLGDEQTCLEKARDLLEKAYTEFKVVNDLKGMYVAKEYEARLLTG